MELQDCLSWEIHGVSLSGKEIGVTNQNYGLQNSENKPNFQK